MLRKIGLLGVVLLVLLVACDRKTREITGKSAQAGSPVYDSTANIASTPGDSHIASIAPGADAGPDGAALYGQYCAACHQMTGQGVPGAFPPLDGSEYVTGDNVERMAAIMVYGLVGEITVKGVKYSSAMAPLGSVKDDELAAIATYIRGGWSNKASEVDVKVFSDVRAKYGSRGMFNITEFDSK